MHRPSPTFGDLLRRFRQAIGLNQAELAARAGLSERGVSDLERGARTTPRPATVRQLADALALNDADRAAFTTAAEGHTRATQATPAPLNQDISERETEPPRREHREAQPPLPPDHRHNLRIPATRILGREREVEAVCALVGREQVRLVTITGAGGIGKTRLSIEVAARMVESFPDGVWQVYLSRLTSPDQVVRTIARVFDLTERGGVPMAAVLQEYLRDKHLLLVLDNFEHVIGATPEVGALLAACPGVTVLATSRVPLRMYGEREYTLRPLDLPDLASLPPLESLPRYAAVALFIERARAVRADFEPTGATIRVVAEICARLDGLPLAIELAAARTNLLSPTQLLKRLEHRLPVLTGGARDLEERQRTMRAAFAWSYDLLSPEEQRLFRRLAVFAGGCTLEAVEAVCAAPAGAEPLGIAVLDGLSALVEHHLVRQVETEGEPRCTMLHLAREYALEELERSGEARALRDAHAAYFHALLYDAQPDVRRAGATAWRHRLRREHDNLRAALRWLYTSHQAGKALLIAPALGGFWRREGAYAEGREWLERLLSATAPTPGSPPLSEAETITRIKALNRASTFAWVQHDLPAARRFAEEALQICLGTQDPAATAEAYAAIGLIELDEGTIKQAEQSLVRGVAFARQSGDMELLTVLLQNLAMAHFHQGKVEEARTLANEGLALGRQINDKESQAGSMVLLAAAAFLEGDLVATRSWAQRGLAMAHGIGHNLQEAFSIAFLALAALREGQGERAARLYGGLAGILARGGGVLPTALDQVVTKAMPAARAQLGEEAWVAAYEAGRALPPDRVVAEALSQPVAARSDASTE